VEGLDTGDLRQESARRVASSAELPMLGLIFALAAEARLVREIRGRLVAVKLNAGIVERPLELWERMLEAFPRVGRAVCQPGWGQSLLRDRFREAIGAVLEELRVGGGSLLIVDACDLAWEIATACYALDEAPERHQALWRQLSDRDVRIALDVLEDLGALAQGAERVRLTELGSWSMSRVAGEPRPGNRLPRPAFGDIRARSVGRRTAAHGGTVALNRGAKRTSRRRCNVARALGCRERRVKLDRLDWPLVRRAVLELGDRLEHVVGGVAGEPRGDTRLALHDREFGGVRDDLEVIPQLDDGVVNLAPGLWKRQGAHHLREVGVRRRADQQATRQPAFLAAGGPEPRPRPLAASERLALELGRLVQARDFLHSQRTTRSARSPPVPRSSSQSWRLH